MFCGLNHSFGAHAEVFVTKDYMTNSLRLSGKEQTFKQRFTSAWLTKFLDGSESLEVSVCICMYM